MAAPIPDQFTVPSWMTPGSTLAGARDLLPDDRGYDYRKSFKGASGDTALLTNDNRQKNAYFAPFMREVVELEEAKHHAAECTSRLVLANKAGEARAAEAVQKAQREVSLKRLAIIKEMLERPVHLCPDSASKLICVTYNNYMSNGDELTHKIQSQYAWMIPSEYLDSWGALIFTDDDEATKSKAWTKLLSAAIRSCPKKDWSHQLRAITQQRMESTAPLHFTKTDYNPGLNAGLWRAPEPTSTALEEYVAHDATNQSILKYTGLINLFRLNQMDQRQSSRINTVIQKTILQDTRETIKTIRERKFEYIPLNTVNATVKIQEAGFTHILTFSPSAGHEACMVSHFRADQDFSADSSIPMGIITMDENIHDIKALPSNPVSPSESKVCIGAYRNSRFNEQELSSIHVDHISQQTRHKTDFKMPALDTIDYDSPVPVAKAVRTSCDGWDILTTSFMCEDKMHTVITAINYPPFGTQYRTVLDSMKHSENTQNQPQPGRPRPVPGRGGGQAPQRAPREDKWLIDTPGKDFFIRGVVGSTMDKESLVYLSAYNDPAKRRAIRERAVEIRNLISLHYSDVWEQSKGFYENLEYNTNSHADTGETMLEVWQNEWRETIVKDIESWYIRDENTFNVRHGGAYWWSADKSGRVWAYIIRDSAMMADWVEFIADFTNAVDVESRIRPDKTQPALADPGVIRLPRRQTSPTVPKTGAKPPPEITQMQARIQALEAKLDRSRQEANNAHLLQEVLSKLDRPSALRY